MSFAQISVRGRAVTVPELEVERMPVIVTGRFLKQARVKDEDYVEGNAVAEPEQFLSELKRKNCQADLFSFYQRIPEVTLKYKYPVQWDNAAVLPITSYSEWWDALSQETRRNVRIAGKKGLVIKSVPFTDEFVAGISGIYNETPLRQGRQFWHYGKDLATVKRDNGTYAERSEFIGAFLDSELVGFIKMVYVDDLASIMQILSKVGHQDKRPTNAMLAKAVEICAAKGKSHLLYCKYVYHFEDALTEFKRRNGFQSVLFPRYFVPLTPKGLLAIKLGVLAGIHGLFPRKVLAAILKCRSSYLEWISRSSAKSRSNSFQNAAVKTR